MWEIGRAFSFSRLVFWNLLHNRLPSPMRLSSISLLLALLFISAGTLAQQTVPPKKAQTTATKQKAKAKAKPAAKKPVAAAPTIILKKSPCMGRCPHYVASFYPDGRVVYEGFKFAPVEGKRELKISASTVATMRHEAEVMQFAQLKPLYSQGATDLPTTTLTVRQLDGSTHTVQVEEGAPVELQNLLRYIEKQLTDGLGVTADM